MNLDEKMVVGTILFCFIVALIAAKFTRDL